jgi:hypothetical protein
MRKVSNDGEDVEKLFSKAKQQQDPTYGQMDYANVHELHQYKGYYYHQTN